jgi:glycosyltransferase involved in cell wall biosynthesis
MNVLLDISAALAQTAGIGRYARELARALLALPDGPALTLYHNRQPLDRMPEEWRALPRRQIPLSDRAWRLFVLSGARPPRAWLDARDCDVIHGTDVIVPPSSRPSAITIHDLSTLLFPQHHTRLHRWFDRFSLPIMARRASAIIADSASTARDVSDRLGVPPGKVRVVHLGVDHDRFHPREPAEARARVQAALNLRPPYVLSVGTLEPRKNLLTLLQACRLLPDTAPTLVLAGGQGWGNQPLSAAIDALGLRKRVAMAGFVDEDLLPDLYAAADAFAYPSLYEGFGLPALEAMACGAPVVASRTSSLPEVVGEAGLLVDPRDPRALAEALQRLAGDAALRRTLSQAGIRQAARFSWERAARETLAVYATIAATP